MDDSPQSLHVLHISRGNGMFSSIADDLAESFNFVSVSTFASSNSVLEQVQQLDPDCVLIEYGLADRTGLDVIREIRQHDQSLPCVLIVENESEITTKSPNSSGVTEYISVTDITEDPVELVVAIQDAVNAHHQNDHQVDPPDHLQVYEQIFHTMQEGACVYDAEGRFLIVNEYLANFYQTTRDELTGQYSQLVASIREQTSPDAFEQLVQGQRDKLEGKEEIHIENGSTRTIEYRLKPLLIEGSVQGVVGIAKDITKQERQRENLRHERDRFSTLFDNFSAPVTYYEFDNGEPLTQDVNPAFEEVFGYSEADARGTALDDLIVPEDKREEGENINSRVRAGEVIDTNVERLAADGLRIFNLRSVPMYPGESGEAGFTIYLDITEEVQRQRELERFKTMVEVSGDPMYSLDADGRFQQVNNALQEKTGYDESELLGEHVSIILSDMDIDRAESLIASLISGDESRSTIEMYLQTAEGEEILCENHIAFLPFEDSFQGTVGVLRDISERVDREEKLRRERNRLDQFASVISHDLRNPLTVAKGRVELAAQNNESENLGDALTALTRMDTMIEDILSLARAGKAVGETESVSLKRLVQECWTIVETADVSLVNSAENTIIADRTRVKQIFENLFRNAIEHGGGVNEVRVGDLTDGFFVEDDGDGIADETLANITDSEYSSHEFSTGFGLNIVNEIATAHGWSMRITSSQKGGARFEFSNVDLA